NSGVINIGEGPNIFRWTIVKEGCSPSSSQVTITNNRPSTSLAGSDQSLCASSAILSGNIPSQGKGYWINVSGTGVISDSLKFNSEVKNLGEGDNIFAWKINKSGCPSSTSQVIITNNLPTTANAGTNQILCIDNTLLAANEPSQ